MVPVPAPVKTTPFLNTLTILVLVAAHLAALGALSARKMPLFINTAAKAVLQS